MVCASHQNWMVSLLTFASNLKPSTATASAFWSLLLLCTKLDFETCISIRDNSGCQHQFADDDDDEKERKRRTEDKVLVTFQLVAKVFHLWVVLRMIFCRECSFENDLLQRMMFCWEWSFENDLLQVPEPRADIQRRWKAVEHERVSQEERTRGHQVLNYG